MKKILFPACIIAAISLSACGGQPPKYDTNEQPVVLPNSPVAADSSGNMFYDSTNVAAGNGQTLPSMPVQSNAAKSTAALNPAHGLPGHRCDIAVGAPLDMPVQQLQTAPPPPLPPANTGGTVMLNPAHGQPGHDCAIPVGQRLNS